MKKLVVTEFIILLVGTVFAWFNFTRELIAWRSATGSSLGCTPGITNPFLTPCFYGAIFFTLAFIISILMLQKIKPKPLVIQPEA
jgi:hypothetical protein